MATDPEKDGTETATDAVDPSVAGAIEAVIAPSQTAPGTTVPSPSVAPAPAPAAKKKQYTASIYPGKNGTIDSDFAEQVIALEACLKRPIRGRKSRGS